MYITALKHINETGQGVVLDRSMFGDGIFAKTNADCGNISQSGPYTTTYDPLLPCFIFFSLVRRLRQVYRDQSRYHAQTPGPRCLRVFACSSRNMHAENSRTKSGFFFSHCLLICVSHANIIQQGCEEAIDPAYLAALDKEFSNLARELRYILIIIHIIPLITNHLQHRQRRRAHQLGAIPSGGRGVRTSKNPPVCILIMFLLQVVNRIQSSQSNRPPAVIG